MRPSVRTKLIVSPNLYGLQDGRRASQKSFRDAAETFRRIRHIKMVKIIAQVALARTIFNADSRAPAFSPPAAFRPHAPPLRPNQSNARPSHRLLNHAPQDRIMRAAQHECAHIARLYLLQIFCGDRSRHIRFSPALFRQRDKERAGAFDDLDDGREFRNRAARKRRF